MLNQLIIDTKFDILSTPLHNGMKCGVIRLHHRHQSSMIHQALDAGGKSHLEEAASEDSTNG